MTYGGQTFHPDCFTCQSCNKTLAGNLHVNSTESIERFLSSPGNTLLVLFSAHTQPRPQGSFFTFFSYFLVVPIFSILGQRFLITKGEKGALGARLAQRYSCLK